MWGIFMTKNKTLSSRLIDHRFGIYSYEQFLIDNKTMKFNKICMTEVINADTMIATYGEAQFNASSSEILAMGNEAYKLMGIDHLIHVYVHSYKTFMAVANADMSDEDFLNLMKENHRQYELITAKNTSLGGVSRFVLAFGDNIIDRVNSAFYMHRDLQSNFIIATDELEKLGMIAQQNNLMFNLLNFAISNQLVVPFYQGIRDNQKGEITKYEALMRIYTEDGKICNPGMFLDVAKKLKLYLPLSKIIIDRALRDFEDKESDVSLNITLYDIQALDFKMWLLGRLKEHPHPQRVIIEFVETENYNKNSELFSFLNKVREIGCQIAVDDFGVGYATYSSIISLRPDIIKIDGDIIKNITTNEDSLIILESIVYMAKLINAKTTAEFVENEDIQKVLNEYNIDYSQGYHYAKPEPLSQLNIK